MAICGMMKTMSNRIFKGYADLVLNFWGFSESDTVVPWGYDAISWFEDSVFIDEESDINNKLMQIVYGYDDYIVLYFHR